MGKEPCGRWARTATPGSVDRGEEATGGAVEGEAAVLPGRALTESRQSLHVAPDRTRIRLVLFRQRVRLRGVLLRQIEPLRHRVEHPVASRRDLLGGGPQEHRAIVRRGRRRGPARTLASELFHAS